MSENGQQRRLSAIIAADVAGYTRLVEQDTDGTVAAWQVARADIIDPTVAVHSGRIVKHTGDGFLVEFATYRVLGNAQGTGDFGAVPNLCVEVRDNQPQPQL